MRTSGHQDFRTSGLQDIRTSGYQDFKTSEIRIIDINSIECTSRSKRIPM